MKNLKKLMLVGISAVMTASLFTGCSYEGKALSDAFTKNQKATSLESKTEIGLRFSAENLSAEEQKQMAETIPMINSMKMTMNSKLNQSGDGKTAKMQADLAIKAGDMPLSMGIWIDANDKGQFKEIIKMPDVAKEQMNGKEYLVFDSSKMGDPSANNADLTKITEDMQKKFSELMIKNMATFDPGFKLVTDKGVGYVTLPEGGKYVQVYEVKLNDKNFKDLIKYSSNNLLDNKDARMLIKDYLMAVTKISAPNADESKTAQAEIDKAFSDFEKGLPQFKDSMNKVLNSFDKVALVGEKGIVIDYSVDNEGYVVNEKGNIDLVFDAPKFIEVVDGLNGTTTQNKPTGIYKLGIDFNTTNFNINKGVEVKFPELNSKNSVQFEDLTKQTKENLKTQAKVETKAIAKVQ